MFGNNKPSFTGFGTGTTTAFGAGGTSAFGTQSPGMGGLFGGAASGSTGTTGSNLFGTTPASSFGQPQSSNAFSFGSSTGSNTTGSLFGSTNPTGTGTSSLFSTPATGTAFGTKPAAFGFGSTPGQATTGSLFSNTGTTPSLFGQSPATGAFGSTGGVGGVGGTTIAFNPPAGQDTMMKGGVTTSISTRHQCITAMKEYENKSLEELRFEDYSANRRAKQAGSTSTGGLFSSTQPAQSSAGSFVFGTGLQSTSTGFGGFGGTSSATPSTFSRPLFGTATTTQSSGFSFGTSTGTQQATSLFGNTARPLFGGTGTAQPSLSTGSSFFGAPAAGTSTNSIGFGTSTQSGGLFGTNKPPAFGTATTSSIGFGTGTSLFAKPASTASSFGFGTNTSSTAFGTSTGTGLFNMKPGGFGTTTTGLGSTGTSFGFGTTPSTGISTFGTAAAKPAFGGFNFGSTTTGTPAFGSPLTTGLGAGTFNLSGTAPLGTSVSATSQAQNTQHLLALASSPYGDNPLFWNLKQQSKERRDDALKPTNPNAQKAALSSINQYKVSPRPATKIKPKSLHNLIAGGKAQLFEGLEDEDFSFGEDTFVPRKSVKKLVLKKGNKSASASNSVYSDGDFSQQLMHSSKETSTGLITRPLSNSNHDNTLDNEAEGIILGQNTTPKNRMDRPNGSFEDTMAVLNPRSSSINPIENRLSAADTTSFLDNSDLDSSCLPVDRSTPHPTGICLTRPGYYTNPTLDEMTQMIDDNGDCFVPDFSIGREGYGNVYFPGVTNVAGLNLDEIVHFRRKEIVVYPDDDKKPPLGEGLNRKAEITLDCVWPADKTSRTPIKSPKRLKELDYVSKLEAVTAKIGAKFIDYRPETGSWVFQVNHFSKYGLLDDSDDDLIDQQLLGQQAKDLLLVQKLKVQQVEKQEEAKKLKLSGVKGDTQLLDDQDMLPDDLCDDDTSYDMQDSQEDGLKKFSKNFEDMEDTGLDSKYLASSMGISVKNIQSMKASFFCDELSDFPDPPRKREQQLKRDYDDELMELRSPWKKSGDKPGLFGSFKHPATLSLPQSPAFSDKEKEGYEPVSFGKPGQFEMGTGKELLRPKPQTFLYPPIMEHKLIPSGLQPQDAPPRIVGTLVRHNILHVKDSLLYRNQQPLVDAACFKGRSFRVGWGPSLTIVHAGSLMAATDEESMEPSLLPYAHGRAKTHSQLKSWTAHIEKIKVVDYLDERDAKTLVQQEELLKIQLEHSLTDTEDECPIFVPQPGVTALHKLADFVTAGLSDMSAHPDAKVQQHIQMVLSLCVALWGELPDAQDLEKEDIYRERQLRREALSQWLSETGASKVATEMETHAIGAEDCLQAIFSKLTVREISEACFLAQRNRDHRLALLLAQAIGSTASRQMLMMQLQKWAELEASQFISKVRQKIYCLLAGQLVWYSKDQEINTCEKLDWKRSLALHLWFKCPPNSSVQQALRQYQQGFQGDEHSQPYCAAPLPPYLEEESQDSLDSSEKIFDTAYHLLCLYADRTYGLEDLLSPTSSTVSHLDYRLSWHLLEILEALQYKHLSTHHTDSIHVNYASQLEAQGLWHWAAFVLLHIKDSFHRYNATLSLLQRHLQVGEVLTNQETFLVEKLNIPVKWLHQAKAIRARQEGNHEAEAQHWLLAGHYNLGHSVVIRHIAADAIINDDDEHLKLFLDVMAPSGRCSGILNWANNGKVFLDFIKLRKRIEELKQSQPTPYDLEELQPDVMSLCTRVKMLTCHNSKDRLCQAEMAKTSAHLLRAYLALRGESPVRLLSQFISELPMPEDYTLQELQALTRAHLLETLG
ncbi:nuclear pore complex protein Nup98-Nup96-like isoform X2 [Physella acuta]|uniref:nuclear pore complex protein Nup98-Nup96-like isoform X2 n=1 Tax=Physella acuta TaxID=109671 RepID=UPI0027DE31B6|nr:nuclear pore complex protein Nup98-Nup96-like isoform X2 [Physella acuta]